MSAIATIDFHNNAALPVRIKSNGKSRL